MNTLEVASSSTGDEGVLIVSWQGMKCGHGVDRDAGEKVAKFLYELLPTAASESCLRELAALHDVELFLEGGAK